jgi:hypothetical protein
MVKPCRRLAQFALMLGVTFVAVAASGQATAPTAAVAAQDRADIEELIARYANFWEFKQCDAWAKLFAEDGSFFAIKGRPALRKRCEDSQEAPFQIHAQVNTALARIDSTHIRGFTNIIYMRRQAGTAVSLEGYGDYHDVFVRTAEGWRFASRSAVVHLQQPLPPEIVDSP